MQHKSRRRLVVPQDVCSEVKPCSNIFSRVNAHWHVIEMRHWQRNALVISNIVLREVRRLSLLSSSVESFFGLLACLHGLIKTQEGRESVYNLTNWAATKTMKSYRDSQLYKEIAAFITREKRRLLREEEKRRA